MMLPGLAFTAADASRQLAWSTIPVTDASRRLAWSALPTAPVVTDERPVSRKVDRLRAVAARALRRAAEVLEPRSLPLTTC